MADIKIVVVEDSESEVFLLRRALALHGNAFDLEVLKDGELALNFIERLRNILHDVHPCVILLDLRLPKRDGLEVLRAIRGEPGLKHTQVVVTSSGASPDEVEQLEQLGATCRMKPRNLAEFGQLAQDLLAICARSAEA